MIEDLMKMLENLNDSLLPEQEEPMLLEGCCYPPPSKACADDLCRICMDCDVLSPEDCDYYIGTLCHLMMHCLCVCLDSCNCFDEASLLRETCVSLLQNLESVIAQASSPDRKVLLACSLKLAKCCAALEACELGSDESFERCLDCLKCCGYCLKCLGCDTAVAKLERCIKALCLD